METTIRNVGRPGNGENPTTFRMKFNADRITGYTPLPKFYQTIRGLPMFDGIYLDNRPFYTTLCDRFHFDDANSIYRFRKIMRGYNPNNETRGIQIMMLSIFGLQDHIQLAMDYINPRQPRTGIITNSIDVFSLALIKTNKIRTIKTSNSGRDMVFDTEDLLILVSKNKLKSPNFMKQYYNASARKYLWEEYRYIIDRLNIEMQIVDDSEIARYYHDPFTLKTSSITEMIQIDQQLKEEVFSNAKVFLTI